MIWIIILALGVVAGTIGGVVGFGSNIILMPILVFTFGPKETVPIVAIAAMMANLSRAAVWWREIDWRVVAVYGATSLPAAVVGASTMLSLEPRWVEAGLGLFLLIAIPVRRWLVARGFRMTLPGMAVIGAGIGFLAGLVATTGPVNTPFYLAYGLTKGAFLSTEAVGSAAISLTKIVTFHTLGALPMETLVRGLIVGCSLMVGSWLAKQVVDRMDASAYRVVIEAMMLVAGIALLWQASVGGAG